MVAKDLTTESTQPLISDKEPLYEPVNNDAKDDELERLRERQKKKGAKVMWREDLHASPSSGSTSWWLSLGNGGATTVDQKGLVRGRCNCENLSHDKFYSSHLLRKIETNKKGFL